MLSRVDGWWRALRLYVMQRRLRSSELVQIVVCAVAGAVVGGGVAGVHWLVDAIHRLAFGLTGPDSLSTGLGLDTQRLLLVPALGGLALGLGALAMRRLRPGDIVDPIEANALHGGRMSMIDSLRLLVATLMSNASGVAVGMEAGYSQLGSGAFSKVGQYFRLRRADLRIFVAAGAAAAIAAAFNAPLAGAFYAYELILGSYSIPALAPVAAAALAGALTERLLMAPPPLFGVGHVLPFSPWAFVLFALLGLLAAAFSILAMRAVTWAERGFRRLPLPAWLRPSLGGLLLSALALLVPQVLGSGHGAIQLVVDGDFELPALAVLLLAKLVASALSLGAGFRGGMFSASLLLGCLLGAIFADLSALVVPQLVEQHAVLMLVGMGAVAAGIIGAPLTMVFLVLEGTGNFPVTVAVLVGVVIASTLVRLTFGYSFSTWRFHQRGIGIRSPHDVGWLADLTVRRLMRGDPQVIAAATPLAEVRAKYPPGSIKTVFVVSEPGEFLGALDMAALHEAPETGDGEAGKAGDFAVGPDLFLLPFENVRTALARFEEREVETLPVLASGNTRSVVGYLTEQYALRRYNQELERRRTADLGQADLFSISEPPR
ncbi:MAG: chloride channel protein [Reyranellaceae bacterium]